MRGYCDNIERLTRENTYFRKVLYTGLHSQLVLMSLLPGEEIGMEAHNNLDQFFRVEAGQGVFVIDGQEHSISDGSAFIVPAGAQHNVINRSEVEALKLYTIYSPANHKDGTVHQTKIEAEESEARGDHFDGRTTE